MKSLVSGLHILDAAIINYINERPWGASTWHIGNAFNLPTARVRVLLNKAEKQGLVRRHPDSQRNNIIWSKVIKAGV